MRMRVARTSNEAAAAVGLAESLLVQSEALVHLFEARVALLLQPFEILGVLLLLIVVTGWPAALAAIATALIGVVSESVSQLVRQSVSPLVVRWSVGGPCWWTTVLTLSSELDKDHLIERWHARPVFHHVRTSTKRTEELGSTPCCRIL